MRPNEDNSEAKINNKVLQDVYKEKQARLIELLPQGVSEEVVIEAIDKYLRTEPLERQA